MEQEEQVRKKFEKMDEEIGEDLGTMAQEQLSHVRAIIATGAFTEDDLHRMLRGQLLAAGGERPCQHEVADEDCDDGYRYTREVGQGSDGGPLDLIDAPRNQLMCPLEERALDGESIVPCWQALRGAGITAGPDDPPLLSLIQQERLQPCEAFHGLARNFLGEMLARSFRAAEGATQDDGTPQALLAGEAVLGRAKEQAARARLNFLLKTGRLSLGELSDMHDHGLPVTDEAWFPCRDDPERTVWYTPGEDDDECPDYVADDEEDRRRYRCPLQVRALLGDRTVPCCEALSVEPDEEMMERAERYQKWEEGRGRRPEELVPPQPETVEEGEGAGGPRDPVRLLNMRPCYLLGQVMAATLYPIAVRVRDQPG